MGWTAVFGFLLLGLYDAAISAEIALVAWLFGAGFWTAFALAWLAVLIAEQIAVWRSDVS
jgi:hypothetical protein